MNHYRGALKKIQVLMQLNPAENTIEYKEMDMLVSLVEAHEEVSYPMVASDPMAYIKYKMS